MTSKTTPVAADADSEQPCWIFAYGSLIWRPGFDYSERSRAYITGWKRRFWQASTDHRGRPGAPGRVVTLVHEPGAVCEGVAYRFADDISSALAYLDQREQGGYRRRSMNIRVTEQPELELKALVYIADENDSQFTGPTPMSTIASIIKNSRGPSGTNLDYYLQLAKALSDEKIDDPHMNDIACRLSVDSSSQSR